MKHIDSILVAIISLFLGLVICALLGATSGVGSRVLLIILVFGFAIVFALIGNSKK